MNGKQLKNSILQWAIQGKLVPQDPNDEPASVLLDKIRQEKERLIKEKKIKRDKNASIIYRGEDNSYYEKILATGEVKCIDEEIPFEIPQGWEWCRVIDVMLKITDGTHNSPTNTDNGDFMYITAKNIKEDGISLANITFVSKDVHDEIYSRCNPEYGDLLYIKDGATTGIVTINNIKKPFSLLSSVALLKPTSEINTNYILFFLRTPLNLESVRSSMKGCAITRITLRQIEKWLVPVPPYEEQQRIVSFIKELLPYLDIYSSLQMNLNLLNININNKLKKSILQEAIQGKLVPQIAEEGTAQELLEQIKAEKLKFVKESKLKKSALASSVIFRGDDNKYYEKIGKSVQCIDEEIPFEIPENWVWVRLDDICSYIHRGKSPKYSDIKKYPVVAQKCNQWSGFSLEKAKFIDPQSVSSYSEEQFLKDEDLMWNSTGLGTLGRMAIYDSRLNPYELAVADSHVTVIRPYKHYAMAKYLYFYFSSYTVQSVIEDKSDGSTKQKELATKTVKAYLVPLPPFAEQKRIVEKVNQLMQLLK